LRDGALIIKTTVKKLESLKPSGLNYGFLIEATTFKCVAAEKEK